MINTQNHRAIKQEEGAFHLWGQNPWSLARQSRSSYPEALDTFLCKSREHFLLDTFVYIAPGINSQCDSLCTRKNEMRLRSSSSWYSWSHGRLVNSQDELLTYCETMAESHVLRFYMWSNPNSKAITEIKDASLQMPLQLMSGFLCPTTHPFVFVFRGLKTSFIVSHPW